METIRLVPAMGKIYSGLQSDTTVEELRYPLIIDYDPLDPYLSRLLQEGNWQIPQKDESNKRGFHARSLGARSAVIDKKTNILGRDITGIKIKGVRYHNLPPLPVPFVVHPSEVDDWEFSPEVFRAYSEDGTPFQGYKNQPMGMAASHAKHEVIMSLVANLLKIPTNIYGTDFCEYSNSEFRGYYKNIHAEMGTSRFLLTRNDNRVSELVLDNRDTNFSTDDGVRIISNLKQAASELGTDLFTFVYDYLFKASGRLLSQMHSSGFIHGPRQSHYMNYVAPTKEFPELAVCDFESAMMTNHLTENQALHYMEDDLIGLLSSADGFHDVCTAALIKTLGTKMDLNINASQIQEISNKFTEMEMPSGKVVEGYVGDFGRLEKMIKNISSPYDIVREMRKDSLLDTKTRNKELEGLFTKNRT